MMPQPWTLLPAPEPRTVNPPMGYFYDNVARPLIADTVRIMMTGLPIDLNKVQELEATLDVTLSEVTATLEANPIVREYLSYRYSRITEQYIADQTSKMRSPDYYLKPFKYNDTNHRSYFMHYFIIGKPITPPDELLPTGLPKWSAKDVKQHSTAYPILARLLAGTISPDNTFIAQAMTLLATHKAELYNRTYHDNISTLSSVSYPQFNPASPDQKHELLTDMLGYESDKLTDAYIDYERALNAHLKYGKPEPIPPKNKYSWDRDNIEALLLVARSEDEKQLFQALVDYSMGAIIKNNFIKSFYAYTIDGRLMGTYTLLGAKTARYTSKNPNLLNMPSTGSIYAKPVKQCFIAPPGYVVWSIDYSSLEDRVLASLTLDPGKLAIYQQELDGHCYSALGYFPDQIYEHIPRSGDLATDAVAFNKAVADGNKTLKALRQDSKPITFKLAYLGMPDSHKGGAITQDIYDGYHNVLYPNIMKQVNEYILPTVKSEGRLHLGLGFYIKSDKPETDVRTLNNSLNQFWSTLTAISINELHRRIDDTFVSSDTIQVTANIYDAIYGICLADSTVIKWLNDNIVEIMTKDFIVGQAVHNEAALEIGTNWSDLHHIDNHASLEDITNIIQGILHD